MTSADPSQQQPIAVVGVSALFPGSAEQHGFWRNILAGTDLLSDVPPGHWLIDDYYDANPRKRGKTYARRGGFLPKIPFDPMENGVPPAMLPTIDTAQLLALVVARQVIDDAVGGEFRHVDRDRTSVILGVASATELVASMSASLQRPIWVKALREGGLPESQVQALCDRMEESYTPWTESTFPGLLGNVVAGRIANRFDLGGTNCVVDAACAGSLAAIRMAVQELDSGLSDMVITGGVDAINDIFMYMCFSKTPAMSPTGDCRPFSADADGTMLGEGLGMVALRRLADAERDGDQIYAVLRGIGSSSDGRAKSIYAPRAEGQALALERTYRAAGYGPRSVELMEAHGTGTSAGDAAEVAGLKAVFGASAEQPWCALGSVKSQIGHTKSAAGAASLIKAVMALHHKILPPTIKIDKPNPALGLADSPFYLNTRARPWVRGANHPRRASVSSFGFGGSNFHVTLEEYRGPARRPGRIRAKQAELFMASGDSTASVLQQIRSCAQGEISAAARDSQRSFDVTQPHRLAVVAGSAEDLERLCASLEGRMAAGSFSSPEGVHYGCGPAAPGKLAFLFPGQGSQQLDMGADLAMVFEQARAAWDMSESVPELAGLHRLVFPAPAFDKTDSDAQSAALTATNIAQPAIGVSSLASLAVARSAGLVPDAVAGHSFGELSALACAGAFDQATFLRLAHARGSAMAAMSDRPGAMVALVADATTAMGIADEAGVTLANHNAPDQVVLAGGTEAIGEAELLCAERKIVTRRLPVATAFHSDIVAGAVPGFRAVLDGVTVSSPTLPVYGNRDGTPFPQDPAALREQLAEQIASPVRFADMIARMHADGVRHFVEIGPGSVLTDLTRRILQNQPHLAVSLDGKGGQGIARLWSALGQLAVIAGLKIDFDFAWDGYALVPPAKKSDHEVLIDGANYGKPYPPSGGSAALPAPNPERPAPSEPGPRAAAPSPQPAEGLQQVQAFMADAHKTAQRAMADAHIAYLQASEALITRMTGGGSTASGVMMPPPTALPRLEPAPLPPAPAVMAPPPVPVRAVPAPPPAAKLDLTALMLAVVSEKTGYPADMLRLDMDLEADLGIDSIKRVEILAAMQERAPGLPEIDASVAGSLSTLGAIVARFGNQATPVPSPQPKQDLTAVMLAVVSEKTGYPAEMLRLDMDLEADLGIDSIKRVEILAAMQERVPGLPEIDTSVAGSLSTLGAIVARFGSHATLPASAPAPAIDIAALVLRVVAEKTGYPETMLSLDMAIEGDLGIDSIKRVEILASVQESNPDLPKIEASELGSLQTLRAIIDRLNENAPAPIAARLSRLGLTEIDAPATGWTMPGFQPGSRVAIAGGTDEIRQALTDAGLRIMAETDAFDSLILLANDEAEDSMAAALRCFGAAKAGAGRTDLRSLVTIQVTDGDFGLAALAKTAAAEWPGVTVKAIDAEPAVSAAMMVRELTAGGQNTEVGLYQDGRRTTLKEVALAAPQSAADTLPTDAVLVVSGGARGVTATCVKALAKGRRLRLLLLGRTARKQLPATYASAPGRNGLRDAILTDAKAAGDTLTPKDLSRRLSEAEAILELDRTIADLQQAGAEVVYHPVDVTDEGQVVAAVAKARSAWGRIDGVIHGAGTLADRRIADKTPDQFALVFNTKIGGLRALLKATEDDRLKLLCLFSSVAGRYGNAGQCDYAMANHILDTVARAEAQRRGGDCVVRSIGWGPWDGGMVDDGLRRLFAERGIALIGLEVGAAAFVAEVTARQTGPEDTAIILAAGAMT